MEPGKLLYDALTESVIGAFYDVYNILDYGFLEHVYSAALERELRSRGHSIGREVGIPVIYKGEEIASQRLDMIIDDCLVVEIKSTALLSPMAKRQLLGYLRATRIEVGLVLHFGPEQKFHRQILTNDRKPFSIN
jgi:GxxExxY protein